MTVIILHFPRGRQAESARADEEKASDERAERRRAGKTDVPPLDRQEDDREDVQDRVEDDGLGGNAKRRLHVPPRLEERDEALLRGKEAPSKPVNGQRPRDAHGRRRVARALSS